MNDLTFIYKTYILFFVFLLINSIEANSQYAPESDPHRGMYIDKFVKTPLNNFSIIDPEFSVLGVDTNRDGIFEKEDAILKYASENHITYLALFDLHRIFGHHLLAWDENLNRTVDLEEHLCRFIKKAKTLYGVTQVGAIGGSSSFFDSLTTFLNRYPQADFDVVNVEYEFWINCSNDFPNFITILNSMYSMKEAYNQAHPDNKMISEVYLAAIYYCNSSFGTTPVVETIDGCVACSPCTSCPNPQPRLADRILHAWFVSDPGSVNIAEQNAFELASTEDSTDFHPILYSESYNTGGTVDWTGVWFPLAPENNIFTAEESYYTSWRNNSAVAFGTPRQNNVQPGGVHWFTSTNMAGHLDHPQILQNTGPYCSTSATTPVTFNYYGPIESNIVFQFWITNNMDSSTAYPPAGGRVNGISGIYQPLTSTSVLHKNIDFSDSTIFSPCNLPEGNYTAHLLLKYDGGRGQTYQCDNSVIVGTHPRLEIVGPSQFCEGDYTYLRTNSVGGTISWYRNGILIQGASNELKVTVDGDYYCIQNGGSGCSGSSDTIHVHVLANPSIAVNAVCNGNGSVTLKTNLSVADSTSAVTSGIGGVYYRWNTGDITDQVTLIPPTTNTTYRVNVTNPYTGCSRTGQITLKSPLQQPYLSHIVINNQPSSPCSSDGSLTAIISASGAPNNFLWSNGATSATITNVCQGTYSVAMNVWAGGCTSYATVTIGTAPANVPIVQPVVQNVSCSNLSDGSIQLNITGGNPPFTYFWEFFPYDSIHHRYVKDQSALFEGIYYVRIIDSAGCNYYDTVEVGADFPLPTIQSISTTTVAGCSTDANASATVLVTGGSPPYSYLWSDSLHQTNQTATSLPSGSLQIKVTDSNGCYVKNYASVPSQQLPLQIELLDSSVTELGCNGSIEGNLFINIHGGTSPYVVSAPWLADSNFAKLSTFTSGIFPIQITDASGCSVSDTFSIIDPENIQFYASVTSTSCVGCQDGKIDLSFSGVIPPYQITWLPLVGMLNGNQIQNLSGGIYSICISDARNCLKCIYDTVFESIPGVFELNINSLLNVYPNPYSSFTTISLSNEKIKNGKIIISNVDGKIVFEQNLSSNSVVLYNGDLTPGIYFLKLFNERNEMVPGVKKLVVIN